MAKNTLIIVFLYMFNKLSSFNIKSDNHNFWNEVFVAQPDSLKESLAGKVFVLAEFSNRKNEGQKIFDFLVSSLDENYYNDEKLLLKDKIEGLKTENIFEASLAKTNLALGNFLAAEKITLDPNKTNLTIGVVYENNIHFSSFGKNKAVLIFPQKSGYESINVETNAFEKEEPIIISDQDDNKIKVPKVFSSIISGEIPKNSYFVFSSESVPEYISEKELTTIISKLPPLTAASQIKNLLTKINNHVPFFGVIIKSFSELDPRDAKEEKIDLIKNENVSSLSSTEKNTEDMLNTSHVINLSQISNKIKNAISFKKDDSENKKIINKLRKEKDVVENDEEENFQEDERKELGPYTEEGSIETSEEPEEKVSEIKKQPKKEADFGIIRTLNTVKQESKMKNNFSFKKSSINIFSKLNLGGSLLNIIDIFKGPKIKFKNRIFLIAIPVLILVLFVSIYATKQSNKRQEMRENFDKIVTEINRKESMLEARMLYDDREGASVIFTEIQDLVAELPRELKEHQEMLTEQEGNLEKMQERIYRISRIEEYEELYDFGSLEIGNIQLTDGNLYAINDNSVYKLDGNDNPQEIEIGSNILESDSKFFTNYLNFISDGRLIQYNLGNDNVSSYAIADLSENISNFNLYSTNIYALNSQENRIDVHGKSGSSYGSPRNWFTETTNISQAKDLYIDGSIYVLLDNGMVKKYHVGQEQDYSSISLEPSSNGFTKILGSNERLYLFNQEDGRLVVLNKNAGNLLNQFIIENLESPKDFAISEDETEIYILDKQRLLKVDLN